MAPTPKATGWGLICRLTPPQNSATVRKNGAHSGSSVLKIVSVCLMTPLRLGSESMMYGSDLPFPIPNVPEVPILTQRHRKRTNQ